LFEFYVLRLASIAEPRSHIELNKAGIRDLLKYLKQAGLVDYDILQTIGLVRKQGLRLWEQVDAAIEIRNSLIYASGVLSYFNNTSKIRDIVKRGTFLSAKDQARCTSEQSGEYIKIVPSELGDRLQVTNQYPYVLCFYLREYFEAMCLACRKLTETVGSA
jgi:hypothetical protein